LEVSLLQEQLSAILTVTVQMLWYKKDVTELSPVHKDMPQNFASPSLSNGNSLAALVEMDITELCKDSLDLAIPSLMDTTLTQGF
jgi:hypothetical protein